MTAVKGIDVSQWQGAIDWVKVKASGVRFAVIRAGYGTGHIDPRFEENYRNARAAGVELGAYWYSYAQSDAEAQKEADTFASAISGKQFEYPVYFDIEESSQLGRGKTFVSNLITAFCTRMEQKGCYAGFYTSLSNLNHLVTDEVRNRFTVWVAQWAQSCSYRGSYGLWQYSSTGSVAGIASKVDLDYAYIDFASVIKAGGYNGWPKTQTATAAPEPVPSQPVQSVKSVDELASEVIAGKWGNGQERRTRLTAADHSYDEVQAAVNRKLNGSGSSSSGQVWYTVRKGDTPSGIAWLYKTSSKAIQQLNPTLIRDVNRIQAGWRIRVK